MVAKKRSTLRPNVRCTCGKEEGKMCVDTCSSHWCNSSVSLSKWITHSTCHNGYDNRDIILMKMFYQYQCNITMYEWWCETTSMERNVASFPCCIMTIWSFPNMISSTLAHFASHHQNVSFQLSKFNLSTLFIQLLHCKLSHFGGIESLPIDDGVAIRNSIVKCETLFKNI